MRERLSENFFFLFFLLDQLTRNEDGKFKHAWDEKTMGAKPKKERKKRDEKDDNNNKEGDKPKRIRKEKKEEDDADAVTGDLAAAIAGAVVKVLSKTKK